MKKLGQHFLVDYLLLDRLVEYGQIIEKDVVLEVGAGTGELTSRLAEKAGRVIAVEIDEKLVEEASRKLSKYNNVELINGDILKVKHKIRGFNKVVSNPPYQISTKLMHWLILSLPERIVLTLQKDFAQKITSPPGSKKYVYTSFLANLLYKCKIIEDVPRTLFKPMPRVDSAVILMERIEEQVTPGEEELKLVKILFTQKMKKLRNTLKTVSERLQLSFKEIEEVLSEELLNERVYRIQPHKLYECAEKVIRLTKVRGYVDTL
ncbi:MAG: 16S rRNA (adenine(1518)-N(6)/adenine(1519)-N(6))-dimethyltransferase RsmA [Thaumarchaeota archaeon]|jgi:16S rRNA (adenine1518-N6/adenine1519-N6)-dimethyltransferase|nr:16S rRNA (adenine(1518)-N(6)/adenine(1519)-N(6))-dimethyltransferase RsmA [Candidatus Geocrenenecus arthurdayi]MCL7388456.1 16S rRNA (adenine(1518)-N(6)/adenine(1519)-N(6))-dimethyltransferase RsmA [Candidatus Geocrenenecus arthurdayi]MCL7390843.1 16S rRNA (adenine(1518)-N(6)/adenine(1519)-N(6))-dimethyltransferase RsmA [Candidatus Geocrenenecus arthurdayi]MCL7396191.1 16S rRNA (adenine(1518)-N(6)/adenine(1519)-N(6))-dimethyltransferase RsmA [Candidatus Geocrenenecus arthurdayi]MCL7401963.1 